MKIVFPCLCGSSPSKDDLLRLFFNYHAPQFESSFFHQNRIMTKNSEELNISTSLLDFNDALL